MLIDSHCHLDKLDLDDRPGGLDEALDAARAQGVGGFLCVGAEPSELEAVRAVAAGHADVWTSAGVHPLAVDGTALQRAQVERALDDAQTVAIGETGLDFFKHENSIADQQASFAWHLEEGGRRQLPVIVHTRNARKETIDCMRKFGDPTSAGVLHCFAEDWPTAVAAMDLGYAISISGIVTFRSADALRDVVRRLPADRLLVETDSPWLSPAPHRGRANEPMRVRRVAECVAELRGESLEAIAEITTANYFRLFSRAVPADQSAAFASAANSTS